MKKHIARLLRKTANRLDPQPKWQPWPMTCTTSSVGNVTVTYR